MEKQPDIIISKADLMELENQLERSKLPIEFICALEQELDRATIVSSKDLPEDVVALGSQVTFKILDTQKTFTKTLCLPADTIKFDDSISVFAPIGAALIGLQTGQCIKWQTQRGLQSVEIVNVKGKVQ
ncbi:GreA/GreB family elongation factor [uncultured Paraglaciecola sp.]|uniref:GreA/GreB family elongation factor n=1 Tax=uncultured Paraglaciecola sp. TaxID=1765024 RepID=UPI0030DC9D9F